MYKFGAIPPKFAIRQPFYGIFRDIIAQFLPSLRETSNNLRLFRFFQDTPNKSHNTGLTDGIQSLLSW